MYHVAFQLPGTPDPAVLEATIEVVVVANARWYLEQWGKGRDPPCCCGCAGLPYKPDDRRIVMMPVACPYVFNEPHVSCQTAAAVHAGRCRAIELEQGTSPALARERHRVELRPGTGRLFWHALYSGPQGLQDVTTELEPWSG